MANMGLELYFYLNHNTFFICFDGQWWSELLGALRLNFGHFGQKNNFFILLHKLNVDTLNYDCI